MPANSTASSPARVRTILFAVFLTSLLVQGWLWFTHPSTDAIHWSDAAHFIAEGTVPPPTDPTPAHPGTTIIIPTGALIALGVSPDGALNATMAVYVSLVIALIVYLTIILRPQSLWWLGVAAILILNPFYLIITPPSVVAGLLSGLYALVLFYAYERKGANTPLIWLGAIAGVLLATRIDMGAALLVTSLPLLWSFARYRTMVALASAALLFGICDIYLWFDPIGHIFGFIAQVGANTKTLMHFGYSMWILFLAGISASLATIFVAIKPDLTSIHRHFLIWLLVASAIICTVILHSDYHPMRYFFPVMILFEVFLPLFVLDMIQRSGHTHIRSIDLTYIALALLLLARIAPGIVYIA